MIDKNSKEYMLWREVFMLRNKYHGMKKDDDKSFKAMVQETTDLYEKYKGTSAETAAYWCCFAIREMFAMENL